MLNLARRALVIAGIAALPLAGAATADASPVPANVVPHGVAAGGNYTGVIANGLEVAFECHGAATGAVSVAINACYITTGGSAPTIALPGTAAATASTTLVPFAPFQLCWTVTATFVDTATNQTHGCTLLPSVGGVPSLVGTGVSESL